MKPDSEIQEEAERLERLAREWIVTGAAKPEPVTLAVLPDSRIAPAAPRRHLRIAVVRDDDAPEFLLLQDEAVAGRVEWDPDPLVLTRSDSAYDVLRDGYEARQEDRLAEFLTPIADRIGAEGFIEDASPEVIEEIAAALEADNLAPGAQLRARADIVEFLEGRLSPSDFISAAIERQSHRPQVRESVAEFLSERISVA